MMNPAYDKQVTLLLRVLPEVAKEPCFALHGGTAINLFVCNMPRLSVDIDLTYVLFDNREKAIKNIQKALLSIKKRLEQTFTGLQCEHKEDTAKLFVSLSGIKIKLEVNTIGRGVLEKPSKMLLCPEVSEKYDAFCSMTIVPFGQLYGGKICAALSRQHPRDLFDIQHLLKQEGIGESLKIGFLLGLLSSNRPMHELLNPHLLDQSLTLKNHFEGMSMQPFNYDDFQATRHELIQRINTLLSKKDKQFLINFCELNPQWGIYDFEKFPAVQWKMVHLEKLKKDNPRKYLEQFDSLKQALNMNS